MSVLPFLLVLLVSLVTGPTGLNDDSEAITTSYLYSYSTDQMYVL
jgi:hypothetical protein